MSCDREAAQVLAVDGVTLGRERGPVVQPIETADAVEAHKVDLAAERMLLAEEMIAAGREALSEIRGPVKAFNVA